MSIEAVEVKSLDDGVVLVTMQDRDGKNTFSHSLTAGLLRAFEQVSKMPESKVVVLTGYDSYFCSGGTQEGLLALHEGQGTFADVNIYRLALDCEIPVIAAMQGHAIGGGFVFGLFADIVIMSRESVYSTNFMRYGFTPGMGATCILPRKIGVVLSEEMLLTARGYRGSELADRGLPFAVLPRVDVLQTALQMARDIADKPRASLLALKARLVKEIRAELPDAIADELAMHERTFHTPEVKTRITALFGR